MRKLPRKSLKEVFVEDRDGNQALLKVGEKFCWLSFFKTADAQRIVGNITAEHGSGPFICIKIYLLMSRRDILIKFKDKQDKTAEINKVYVRIP